MTSRKTGFTLIGLLVVIAIIGILSAVVLTSLNSSRQKAQDSKAVNDVKQVALALELARSQSTGDFPTAAEDSTNPFTAMASATTDYLTPFPHDSINYAVASGSDFCISATLSDAAELDYFNATEAGAGYSDTAGSALNTCPIS